MTACRINSTATLSILQLGRSFIWLPKGDTKKSEGFSCSQLSSFSCFTYFHNNTWLEGNWLKRPQQKTEGLEQDEKYWSCLEYRRFLLSYFFPNHVTVRTSIYLFISNVNISEKTCSNATIASWYEIALGSRGNPWFFSNLWVSVARPSRSHGWSVNICRCENWAANLWILVFFSDKFVFVSYFQIICWRQPRSR